MNDRRPEFKKWLIDEMKRTSTLSYSEIVMELSIYSRTPEFEEKYRLWRQRCIKQKKFTGPKHISEVFEENM